MHRVTAIESVRATLEDAGFLLPSEHPVKWVGSVLPAALWAIDPTSTEADENAAAVIGVERAKRTIVIMVDGLGVEPLSEHLSYARTLRSFSDSIVVGQSTVPSTTAAALTSFTTGKLPGTTRMVGYAVRRADRVMNLLNFEEDVVVEDWQSEPTVFERLSGSEIRTRIITKPKFRGSGLTRAAFRGAEFVGREGLEERFGAALEGVVDGAQLQVVYWSDIDHEGHHSGVSSIRWAQELEEFDTALGAFLGRVPRDTLVLLTADHGMVNVERIIDVAETPQLSEGVPIIAGEGRAVHLHAIPGEEEAVVRRWTEYLDGVADVVPAAELPALLGAGSGITQVGAAMVLVRGNTVILDSRSQRDSVFKMRGVHGGLTRAEMAIPLLRLA